VTLQLSPLSSHVSAESVDVKLCDQHSDIESDEDRVDDSLQYFVSSAAGDTPLVGPLLASVGAQHGKLATYGTGLETAALADGGIEGCNAVVDFTNLLSPTKVNKFLHAAINLV